MSAGGEPSAPATPGLLLLSYTTPRDAAWSHDKNALLIAERGVSFEAVVAAIEAGELLDVLAHPNPERCPGQRILVVRLDDYAHLVPFVETADGLLLKTIIPSRKATRRYISET